MSFPVYFNLFGHRIHPHLVLEIIAYSAGFQLYLLLRRRWKQTTLPAEQNMWIIVGCVFGALAGSKVMAFLESYQHYTQHLADPRIWMGGKTIVGGLLGGWAGVEIAKLWLGIRHSTGDAFVFPLIVGMCIGRVGCFLTGLEDHTHGVHSTLPWAVDFGDGPRHPTQLYEIVFLLLLAVVLLLRTRSVYPNGQVFRLFMLAYLMFRFFAEFLKPRETPVLGISAIQMACLGATAVCVWQLIPRPSHSTAESHAAPASPET